MTPAAAYSYRCDPEVPRFPDDKPVLFFDGICRLCTGFADFVLRHDRTGAIRVATAQSALGQAVFRHYGLPTEAFASNLLIAEGRACHESEAFIETMARLPAPWPAFRVLRIAPRAFRDWVYDPIARHRHLGFGKRQSSRLPTPEEASRFL